MRYGKAPLDNKVRFERHFTKTDNCWIWHSKNRHQFGYGKFRLWPGRKNRDAHKVAWMLYRGEVPKGLFVLHKCDNPPCVNPDHLYLGTHLQNMRDAKMRQRMRVGERNPAAKLSTVAVETLRSLRASGAKVQFLSEHFNISQSQVYRIVNRERRAIS